MSLRLVRISTEIESNDFFHLSRLLILLKSNSGKSNKPVDGIMKLAKLDFLLRYPNCYLRVLKNLGKDSLLKEDITSQEVNTIEAKMIRFRYGPWDGRYRRWIGLLVARGLADTYLKGRTVKVCLTAQGHAYADKLSVLEEFEQIVFRSNNIAKLVGTYSATRLKNYIYEVFPELLDMKWGEKIEI